MVETESLKELLEQITAADLVILLPGTIIFAVWLLRTSWGRASLDRSLPRRNNMPLYLPFVPMVVWLGLSSVAITVSEEYLHPAEPWVKAFADNMVLLAGSAGAIAIAVWLARNSFARRLKGFGLDWRTIPRDLRAGVLNLAAVWPVMIAMLAATLVLGKVIFGPDYKMPQHQELELITEYQQPVVRISIIIVTVLVGPVAEECVFRGLLQSVIRSFLGGPWKAVLITAAIFAGIHTNTSHWPALFVLGTCLGYSYEKSGSLFRPIFIHSIFNGIAVLAAIYST
jgi:uncharacterized protein